MMVDILNSECKDCGRKFGSEESLQQHIKDKHSSYSSRSSSVNRNKKDAQKKYSNVLIYVLILLIVFGGGYGLVKLVSKPVLGAPVGVHWHAYYEVFICGERQAPFPPSPGNTHSHGDGKIHIHPSLPQEALENANVGAFFRNIGGEFDSQHITMPDGRAFKNGDLCGGKTSEVKLIVNGRQNDKFESYTPRDGDVVKVEFG